MDDILSGNYVEDVRFLLEGQVIRDSESIFEDYALNDIVIQKWNIAHLLELKTYIDGQSDWSGYQNANISSNQGDLRIGSNHNNGSTTLHHNGQVEEVEFCITDLTPSKFPWNP